jgi:hypothetical protein
VALSEKKIALKSAALPGLFAGREYLLPQGPQDTEYSTDPQPARAGRSFRRSYPACPLFFWPGHAAFASCTMLLPSFISAMLWVTMITVLFVSCRIT